MNLGKVKVRVKQYTRNGSQCSVLTRIAVCVCFVCVCMPPVWLFVCFVCISARNQWKVDFCISVFTFCTYAQMLVS